MAGPNPYPCGFACWDETGGRPVGQLNREGRCEPEGEPKVQVPMMHVWIVDHPCGPFAGIEGHGGAETTAATTATEDGGPQRPERQLDKMGIVAALCW
jgi:hypothetical protein